MLLIDSILALIAGHPFSMPNFALKEIESILLNEKKSSFSSKDVKNLLIDMSQRYNLGLRKDKLSFIEDLMFRINKRGVNLLDLFPKDERITMQGFVAKML